MLEKNNIVMTDIIHKVTDLATMEVSDTITNTVRALAGVLTAATTLEPKDVLKSYGSLAQRIIAYGLLDGFKKEWQEFKKKGVVTDGFERSKTARYTLLELLNFLNDETPDEERFNLIKQIFFVASTKPISDDAKVKPLEFMRIAKLLSQSEILVINATYTAYKNKAKIREDERYLSASSWVEYISKNSGLDSLELVEIAEDTLINKKLLSDRRLTDRSGVNMANFRLRQLGIDFCEYVAEYDTLKI